MIICLSFAGVSCSKSEIDAGSPSIELVNGDNLIIKDTSAQEASTLHFKVHCKWNGENTLTNLIVANNGTRVVDEGMNIKEFERNIDFTKSSNEIDSIAFTIRDIRGRSSTKTLRVNKSSGSGGGELVRYNNITLDAQNTTNGKSFLSANNGSTFTLQDAFGAQQNINILYYYDNITSDGNTLASPGANVDASIFTGTYGLSNWTTKNTSRFNKISLSQQQFEAIVDPVFVVNSYGSVGYRKAKNLAAGDAYAFKVENTEKYGILSVSEVIGQESGKVVISIVIQK